MTSPVHAINTTGVPAIYTTLTWSALSHDQKAKFIDSIRDLGDSEMAPELIRDLNNYVERYIESLYEDDSTLFAEESEHELSETFGIKASTYFRHSCSQGDGFCFDRVKSVDLFKFFTKINLLDINSKLNDATTPIFKEFVENYIDVIFERVNHHYDHENSVTVNAFVYHNFFEDNDEEEESVTDRVFSEPEFVMWLKENYTEDNLDAALREWNHDYCLKKFAEFRNMIDSITEDRDSLLEVYNEAIECFLSDSDATFDVSNPDKIVLIVIERKSAIVKITNK